jgi:hypothetical protein
MVEKAAFAPRRFGLAPQTNDLFPTETVSSDFISTPVQVTKECCRLLPEANVIKIQW